MPIRPANTVNIIRRRLDEAERAAAVDAMELLGLQDELSRLERKWRQQIAEGSERRRPDDLAKLNAWFDRLERLAERCARQPSEAQTAEVLQSMIRTMRTRPRD